MSDMETAAQALTEEDARELSQKVGTFRDELPPRQREAFSEIVAAGVAQVAGSEDEVQGFNPLVKMHIGQMFEGFASQKKLIQGTGTAPPSAPDLSGISGSSEETSTKSSSTQQQGRPA